MNSELEVGSAEKQSSSRGARTERAWRRAQAVSGLIFATFSTLHLVNLLFAVVPGRYDAFQHSARLVYQNPIFESLFLFAPLLVHVAAGLRQIRRRKTSKAPLRLRLQRYTAWFLIVVIGGHAFATRAAPLIYGVSLGQLGVAFTVAWFPLFFAIYYPTLALTGFYHTANGVVSALSILSIRVPPRALVGSRFWAPLAIGAAMLLVGFAGLTGWIYPIEDPYTAEFARIFVGD